MIESALQAAMQIQRRIDDAVAPLQTEMKVMKWKPEYQVIVWEALAHKVSALANAARAKTEGREPGEAP